jgi:ketosteroid isomerase-like protein
VPKWVNKRKWRLIMNKLKLLVYLTIVALLVAVGGGCSKDSTTSKTPTNFYFMNDKGDKIYLKAEDKQVVAAKQLAEEFAKTLNERDYTNINGKAEYHLYTQQFTDSLVKAGDEQATIKVYKDNQIKSKYDSSEISSMVFNKEYTQCELAYVVKAHITEASDAFLKNISSSIKGGGQLGKNAVFSREYQLTLKKDKDKWKIDNFSASSEIALVR